MTPEDQYKGMPIWMQRTAQKNLRAADRSIGDFNTRMQGNPVAAPSANPVPSPTPVPAPTFNFTLGSLDTSIGGQPLQPVTTAASRAIPEPTPVPNSSGENFGGHMVNPQTPSDLSRPAYNQTSFRPSQSYQDWQAKHEQRRQQFGWSAAQQ